MGQALSSYAYSALKRKAGGIVKRAAYRKDPDKKTEVDLLADFGKDKSPKLRASGQVNFRTKTEMKACNEIADVSMVDGAFTTVATVQLNSAYEPVDAETEQPRGFDQFGTFYKRYRVDDCAIQIILSGYGGVTNFHETPVIVGITGSLSGEGPANLREAMENPRTVYKVFHPRPATGDAKMRFGGQVDAVYDCGEIFGSKKNYQSLDDVVGFSNGNPSVILLGTIWVCPINGSEFDDYTISALVMTNQKLTWFGPEKLTPS